MLYRDARTLPTPPTTILLSRASFHLLWVLHTTDDYCDCTAFGGAFVDSSAARGYCDEIL